MCLMVCLFTLPTPVIPTRFMPFATQKFVFGRSPSILVCRRINLPCAQSKSVHESGPLSKPQTWPRSRLLLDSPDPYLGIDWLIGEYTFWRGRAQQHSQL